MNRRTPAGSLLAPPGNAPIHWDEDLLRALQRCILAECSVRETARRLGIAQYAVARGAMILSLRLLRGDLGDYNAPCVREAA